VRSVHIVGQPGGWGILVKYGMAERALAAQRSQQVRVFRKFETLVGYLKGVGIARFDVDAANWDADSLTTRSDTSAAEKAHRPQLMTSGSRPVQKPSTAPAQIPRRSRSTSLANGKPCGSASPLRRLKLVCRRSLNDASGSWMRGQPAGGARSGELSSKGGSIDRQPGCTVLAASAARAKWSCIPTTS
jgi:hypothetical protein